MIAMQYSFVLPADYDMTVIDRRIREKGPLLDGFPRLRFKAYLSARKDAAGRANRDNLYAPFYLWDAPQGLGDFLSGPGFAAVTQAFGWPAVRTWMVWQAETGSDLGEARFASRQVTPIAAYSDLGSQREAAMADGRAAIRDGALAAVAGFDPTAWAMVRFHLWRTLPPTPPDDAQIYDVGHISLPAGS